MRSKRRLIAIMLLIIFIVCDIIPGGVIAEAIDTSTYPTGYVGMGDIAHYNGITFGDYYAQQADVEGAIAIQGNFKAPDKGRGFDITVCKNFYPTLQMGHKYDDNGYPCFLLGGKISSDNPGNLGFLGDYVTVGESSDPNGIFKGRLNTAPKNIIYEKDINIQEHFKELKKQVDKAGDQAAMVKGDGSFIHIGEATWDERNDFKIGKSNYDKVLVSNIPESDSLSLVGNDVYYPTIADDNIIIIKSNAKTVDFGRAGDFYKGKQVSTGTPQDATLHYLAPRVIWYLPNATKINTSGRGIVGTVIAPNADFDALGGSLNGQLFCKSLSQKGGFELHNFTTDWGMMNSLLPINEDGGIKIIKKNESGNLLSGASFKIYTDSKCNNEYDGVEYVTDSYGVIEKTELPLGTYYVKEIKAPNEYELNNNIFKVELTKTGKAIIEVNVVDKKKAPLGSVELLKKDEDTEKVLVGVEFDLYNSANKKLNTQPLVTDKDGIIKVGDLSNGTYYFKESRALKGYALDTTKHTFNIDSLTQSQPCKLTVFNKLIKGQAKIIKLNKNGNKLSGATFKLYKEDNLYNNNEYITDDEGVVEVADLPIGNYYFIETKAPIGYKLDSSKKYEFTIANEGDLKEIEVVNESKPGTIKVTKKDKDSNKPLAGAGIKLYQKDINGNEISVYNVQYTPESGEYIYPNLQPGKYYLKEVVTPKGYVTSDVEYEATVIEGQETPIDVVIENEQKTGSIKLIKESDKDQELLQGAEFDLYNSNNDQINTEKLITNANGEIIVDSLKPGDYYFVETKAPVGYQLDGTKHDFTIDFNQQTQKSITVVNRKGSVELTKVDSETWQSLKGAKFELYKGDNTKYSNDAYITDALGNVKIDNLEPGKYYFKEIQPPVGYLMDEEIIKFTIAENQSKVVQVFCKNTLIRGSVELIKKDDSGNLLKGAKFRLLKEDKSQYSNKVYTTNDQGRIEQSDLPYGKYYFEEIEAPKGYLIVDKQIEFNIKEVGNVKVSVENKLIKGKVKLIKADSNTNEKLDGVEFQLYKDDNLYSDKVYTTVNGGVISESGLPYGSYYFEETKTIEGYVYNKTKVPFNIVDESEVEVNATNDKIVGAVKLLKVNKDDNKLKGAKFKLYNDNGNQYDNKIYTTDSNGEISIPNLNYGSYYFEEVQAPEGYILDKTHHLFNIDINGEVENVKVVNNLIRASVKLIKEDSDTGAVLKGAQFKLYQGSSEYDNNIYTSNEEGVINVEDLPYGEYYFKEIKAPQGYELNDEKIPININSNKLQTIIVTNSIIKGKFKIVKSDEVSGDLLSGAKFKIYNSDKTEYSDKVYTTNNLGITEEITLPYGKYYYKEIEAPKGYYLNDEYHEFSIVDKQLKVQKVTNKAKPGSVKLVKVDSETREPVAGAGFDLYKEDGTKIGYTSYTPQLGEFTISNLAPGKYYFIESAAPNGYEKDNKKIDFEIKVNQEAALVITVENKIIKGIAQIIKRDSNTGKLLEGAEFDIYTNEGNKINEDPIVAVDGKCQVDNLRPGEYYVVETKAPSGYRVSNKHWNFKIAKSDTVKVMDVVITNDAMAGIIKLTKKAVGTDILLEGAEFDLYDSNNNKLNTESLISDEDGKVIISELRLGSYYLIETKAPIGYVLDTTPIDFKVESDGQIIEKDVYNAIKLGSVKLVKVDEESGAALEDAEFSLYDSNNVEIAKGLVTDSNGEIQVDDLIPADYYFVETKAPLGHVLKSEPVNVTVKFNQKEVAVFKAKNNMIRGNAVLTKREENSEKLLSGAKYKLCNNDGTKYSDDIYVTDKEGTLRAESLPYGEYYFEEVEAPLGYELESTPINFTIREDGIDVNVKATNKAKNGTIRIIKVDSITNKIIAGAGFDVYKENGDKITDKTQYTGNDGSITLCDLEPGKYYLVETNAPLGYIANVEKIEFEIVFNQDIVLDKVVKNDVKRGSIILNKVNSETNTSLEGAEFSLYDSNDVEIRSSLVTDEDGKIEVNDLVPGEYYFKETKAPAGYVIDSTEIKVEVKLNQTKPVEVKVDNEIIRGSVVLNKVDEGNGKVLEGAEYQLFKKDGIRYNDDIYVTAKDGTINIESLPYGEYYFKEVKAPIGYELDNNSVNFEIKEDGTKVSVVATNKAKDGSVKLIKLCKENGKPLVGAGFEVYKEDGTRIKDVLYTNNDGTIIITDLEVGKYYFKEVEAPEGYNIINEKTEFEIKLGQEGMLKVEVLNAQKTGSIKLVKKDEDNNKLLKGAEFNLYTSEGVKVNETPLVTDENGEIVVDDLIPNEYYFMEAKAPEGYELNTSSIKATVILNQQEILEVEVFNKEKVASVELNKMEDGSNKLLEGAEFDLYSEDGTKINIQPLRTDNNGKLIVNKLKRGNYYFIETKSPIGYELDSSKISFEINPEIKAVKEITVTNKAKKGTVSLIKVAEEDRKALKGAGFDLYKEDGTKINIETQYTGDNGIITISDLEPGKYYFKEVKAPDGYVLDNKNIEFEIGFNQLVALGKIVTNKKVVEDQEDPNKGDNGNKDDANKGDNSNNTNNTGSNSGINDKYSNTNGTAKTGDNKGLVIPGILSIISLLLLGGIALKRD